MLTIQRRLGAGPVRGDGSRGKYRELAELEGEPHIIRRDLAGDESQSSIAPKRAIAVIAHITDRHVTDVQSPARFSAPPSRNPPFGHKWGIPTPLIAPFRPSWSWLTTGVVLLARGSHPG